AGSRARRSPLPEPLGTRSGLCHHRRPGETAMKPSLRLPLAALAAVLAGCATSVSAAATATATASVKESASEDATASIARMLTGDSGLQGAALEKATAKANRHPLGSMENPVRVAMPQGERAYLARLRCPDGAAPRFERQGSGGDSPYGNIVDYYAVECAGAEPVTVIMDMYHRGHVETRAVPGFTIVAP